MKIDSPPKKGSPSGGTLLCYSGKRCVVGFSMNIVEPYGISGRITSLVGV